MFQHYPYYSKRDIYDLLKVPPNQQGGHWNTGYARYNDDFFIFANLGEGRTGHDYDNKWIGDQFHWEGKTSSHAGQLIIQAMLHPKEGKSVYLFYRESNRDKFSYAGKVKAAQVIESTPVKIVWQLIPEDEGEESTPVLNDREIVDGTKRQVTINVYERNPEGRRKCLDHYGPICQVCDTNMETIYGELAKGFIHIHHIKKLADHGEYKLDPLNDLIPVCPNCHGIIHRTKEMVDYRLLREIVLRRRLSV